MCFSLFTKLKDSPSALQGMHGIKSVMESCNKSDTFFAPHHVPNSGVHESIHVIRWWYSIPFFQNVIIFFMTVRVRGGAPNHY